MTTNKTIVLITGANSGIGLETVIALSQFSPNYHILLGTRSIEKGKVALTKLQADHASTLQSTISLVQIDVTSQDSISSLVEHINSTYGKLDILISNAGIIVHHPCDTITHFRLTFETNVFGPGLLVEALEPLLRKSSSPRIVHVSSEQGSITSRLDPEYQWKDVKGDIYRSSKAALNMLAACQRYNYRGWGIKVCAFNPGYCVSNLTGEGGREMRVKTGARPASDAAEALVGVLEGKGGEEEVWEGNGMVDLDGGLLAW
ncbi:hypothetical protein QBC44DRAFT_299258 [Cladorrhinum sp. PSN332]|nr:hypothetical protein QBC44DRAFT_299258 [Cladorrhinum sp. PSN332]